MDAGDRGRARRLLRERRAAIGRARREAADRAIAARLEQLVAQLQVRTLAAYWPIHGEPDLRPALHDWHAAGIVVALPRVIAAGAPLAFGCWDPAEALEAGPFGTLHPPAVAPGLRPDLIVVPCLGFDARCYRLGYGGGFYDRTLAELAGACAVGVAYDDCEVGGFDAHEHDLPLDWVVTERRLLRRPDPPA